MSKRLICLLTAIILILSMTSCSLIEGLVKPSVKPQPTPDTGEVEETPDNTDPILPPDDETNDGTKPTPPESSICDCWADADGDAICDSCGSSGLVIPDEPEPPKEETMPTIYLAGDSTVKTYEDGQYIAGWGQFLDLFLAEDIKVVNAAHGGRSSRSFINEGRLYDIEGNNYTFSQNGGNSIGDSIKEGDYLFIQFGHNDDASKLSNYTTIYDRMVPLGQPDANGIYPVIPAEKSPTTYLPDEYKNAASDSEESKALTELAKYGDEYYAYGSGTYKWYLKQYIDFARSVGATPVLITPVARVKFNSNGEIIGGAGLHGENFAYVEAVRQLANEENCLLIDLFAESKEILETATSTYANYLMALKPNELTGVWPMDYDTAYGNTELGYTGIEATHYNKYGAFLQAARVAEAMLGFGEGHPFYDKILTTPEKYINPSNLIGRNTVKNIEDLFTVINVTCPYRDYYDPQTVVDKIAAIPTKVTAENYLEVQELCEVARYCYAKVNVDDRAAVTNFDLLLEIEAKVKQIIIDMRPEPTRVVIFKADDLLQDKYDSTVTEGDFTLVATADKAMEKKSAKVNYTYGDETYSTQYGLSVGGSAKFGQYRYVSFEVDGPCSVTCVVMSSSKTDVRTLNMVNSSGASVGSFEAGLTATVTTVEVDKAGTYSVGSAGSGMYIFAIIIEYFE